MPTSGNPSSREPAENSAFLPHQKGLGDILLVRHSSIQNSEVFCVLSVYFNKNVKESSKFLCSLIRHYKSLEVHSNQKNAHTSPAPSAFFLCLVCLASPYFSVFFLVYHKEVAFSPFQRQPHVSSSFCSSLFIPWLYHLQHSHQPLFGQHHDVGDEHRIYALISLRVAFIVAFNFFLLLYADSNRSGS